MVIKNTPSTDAILTNIDSDIKKSNFVNGLMRVKRESLILAVNIITSSMIVPQRKGLESAFFNTFNESFDGPSKITEPSFNSSV